MQRSRPSAIFLNRVYPPADGATGQLLAELAPALASNGWEISVVTSRLTSEMPSRETQDGVHIERVRGLPFTRASHLRRALCYLALYPALFWRVLRLPATDWIVVMTDPPLLLVFAPLLAWLKGARLAHWAQDLYPELAEETGLLKRQGMLAGLLRGLSTWALRRCDLVIALGRCMQTRLFQRGLEGDRIQQIPNWAPHTTTWPDPEARAAFRAAQGWTERLVVMYSGNFGLAHSFDAMLDAAAILQRSEPQILFALAGQGPRRKWIEAEVRRRELVNVQFLPFQTKENLYPCLSAADLHVATMRQELCGLVVPSKVYGILAAGCPCVFLGPRASEAARLIESHGCGSVLEDATGAELAQCLAQWMKDPPRLQAVSARCRELRDALTLGPVTKRFQALLGGSEPEQARRATPSSAQVDVPVLK